jgi:hypothetical protein
MTWSACSTWRNSWGYSLYATYTKYRDQTTLRLPFDQGNPPAEAPDPGEGGAFLRRPNQHLGQMGARRSCVDVSSQLGYCEFHA